MFDQSELDLLKTFASRPSMDVRDQILREKGWIDQPGEQGHQAVRKAGSLVGFMIARYGTDDPALDDRDWELLHEWVAKGMPTEQHVQR